MCLSPWLRLKDSRGPKIKKAPRKHASRARGHPFEFMKSPLNNQSASNTAPAPIKCHHSKHATWSDDHGGWLFSKTNICGPHGCDAGRRFETAKERNDTISKAVTEKLLPSLIALDEIKDKLAARFSCSPTALLQIHTLAVNERSKAR
jgi:hypothetical protein